MPKKGHEWANSRSLRRTTLAKTQFTEKKNSVKKFRGSVLMPGKHRSLICGQD